jgi:hypothetical protein
MTAATRLGMAAPILAALALAPPALGGFEIDGTVIDGSRHKLKSFDRAAPGNAGGTVRCPKDERILNGGAFWHQTGIGPDRAISNLAQLTSSAPLDGRTWYADGRNNAANPRTLTAEVRCLPKRQLKDVVTRKAGKTLQSGTYGQVRARCPEDYEPISGGTFLSEPGEAPRPGVGAKRGRITGSFPDVVEWRGIGGNFSEGRLALRAPARCYPEDGFDNSARFYYPDVAAGATGGGYLSCLAGERALTGGAWWLRPGENEPDPALATQTYLSGNAPTFDLLGFYFAGLGSSVELLPS